MLGNGDGGDDNGFGLGELLFGLWLWRELDSGRIDAGCIFRALGLIVLGSSRAGPCACMRTIRVSASPSCAEPATRSDGGRSSNEVSAAPGSDLNRRTAPGARAAG